MDCQKPPVDKALTLDLNGKVVKVKIVRSKAKQTISAFAVAESATLTVLNGLLGGSSKGADNRAIEANGGTVILRNTILQVFRRYLKRRRAVLMNRYWKQKCNFGCFYKKIIITKNIVDRKFLKRRCCLYFSSSG